MQRCILKCRRLDRYVGARGVDRTHIRDSGFSARLEDAIGHCLDCGSMNLTNNRLQLSDCRAGAAKDVIWPSASWFGVYKESGCAANVRGALVNAFSSKCSNVSTRLAPDWLLYWHFKLRMVRAVLRALDIT